MMRTRIFALALVVYNGAQAFSSSQSSQDRKVFVNKGLFGSKPYFVTEKEKTSTSDRSNNYRELQNRKLGSQEHLMLPRQYSIGSETFPQMSHVSCTVLNATPDTSVLKTAIEAAMKSHPMLRARVTGTGEPTKRIDLFQMVRSGEPDPLTFQEMEEGYFSANDVLTIKTIAMPIGADIDDCLNQSWKETFNNDLDLAVMDIKKGPLWSIKLHRFDSTQSNKASDSPCALLLTFNHAISDQSSANLVTDEILSNIAQIESDGSITNESLINDMPKSLEENVLGSGNNWEGIGPSGISFGTIKYVIGKAMEGFKNPVILPDDAIVKQTYDGFSALTTISGNVAGGEDKDSSERRSTLQFTTLSELETTALLKKCRENNVSMTNALSAAVVLTSTDFVSSGTPSTSARNYKVLQSLDMRRFGNERDKCESVSCQAGSMDLMIGPLKDGSGNMVRSGADEDATAKFWNIAKEGKEQTLNFIESNGPENAVRVFDFAMTIADLNNLVHLTAKSKSSKGRAYSAGISNVGVYEKQLAVKRLGDNTREYIKSKHGRYEVKDVYFATSHARSGCLYQVSCMTVNGQLKFTFHPATPIVSEADNKSFANAFMDLLRVVSGTKCPECNNSDLLPVSSQSVIPANILAIAAFASGLYGIGIHANAWQQFFNSVQIMKDSASAEDFWAAINFWIFFAVGHPLLQPILWISDVLHGSPGPRVAELVPATFLFANIVAIYLVSSFKEIRNAVNIAAVSAFISYVGAGLDGVGGLGDFNLQLDDNYGTQVVKGCPAYDEVRQSSMDNFDITKYEGLWYEHKFHDWTQFKEVYDTTLDIKLTQDGKGWIDDFGVKGPSPDSAKLSWDKSPVANGAHYFLFGRVDERDPPGVLRESGFGVEFPNYIVDVQKDSETGEYKEAIQFQCLERGGVRVFEGINFMSRSPNMSDVELEAMHKRAEKAGMYPYGAAPEQMHRVARRGVDVPEGDVDNKWQAMWRAIGVDKLLELLTESIEDGGR